MAAGRHRQARHRQTRRPALGAALGPGVGSGLVKVAVPGAAVALLATGSAVAFPEQPPASPAPLASSSLQLARESQASRDALRPPIDVTSTAPKARPAPTAPASPAPKHLKKQAPIPSPSAAKTRAAAVVKAKPKVTGSKYTTTDLNVWTAPEQKGALLTVLAKGSKVSVTGETDGRWAEIVRGGESRWVRAEYLAATKPVAAVERQSGAVSAAACKSGSAVEDGLTEDAIRVHRAVCAQFPSVSSYGGLRPGDSGAHGSGRGLDVMVTGSLGDEIAAWLKARHRELGISELIWEQEIWTVQRGGEGWRGMEDRGGATENHFDHVHVTVYGDRGTV